MLASYLILFFFRGELPKKKAFQRLLLFCFNPFFSLGRLFRFFLDFPLFAVDSLLIYKFHFLFFTGKTDFLNDLILFTISFSVDWPGIPCLAA